MMIVMAVVIGVIVMRRRRVDIAMRVVMMLDGIAARVARMRPEYRDQPRDNGAQQRQKDDCLNHSRALALHQINIFNRDRAAVAEIHHQHGKTDRSFCGRHRQHQKRKHLSDDVAEEGRERHQIDVDREQDQLDRHQDHDDVLAVEEDAEDSEREQDRADRQIVPEADRHCTHSAASASCKPWPEATLRTLMASSGVRAFCTLMSCRLMLALWRSVSTMAPIIATRSTIPAIWK